MGYRSEVAWVLRFDNEEKLDAYINLLRYKNDEHINQALREIQRAENGNEHLLFFHDDGLKWYDDFEDVKAHHFIMEHAVELYGEDESVQVGWRFIRVGEESDDIQEESGGDNDDLWQYIYPTTHISNDLPIGKPVIEEETKGETV